MKKQLNTTLTYVLSIIGLLCCCFGGLGVLLSGPAYVIAQKKVKGATENPDDYDGNINAMNTAKTIALIVLIINVLYLIYSIYIYSTGDLDEALKEFQEAMKELEKTA